MFAFGAQATNRRSGFYNPSKYLVWLLRCPTTTEGGDEGDSKAGGDRDGAESTSSENEVLDSHTSMLLLPRFEKAPTI